MLVCSLCGRPPVARIDEAGVDENGWRMVEKVPDYCPTPDCLYHDRVQIDGDWLVERDV